MKACRLRGPAGETYLAACGDNAQKALYLIVEEMNFRDKAVTAEAELLLTRGTVGEAYVLMLIV